MKDDSKRGVYARAMRAWQVILPAVRECGEHFFRRKCKAPDWEDRIQQMLMHAWKVTVDLCRRGKSPADYPKLIAKRARQYVQRGSRHDSTQQHRDVYDEGYRTGGVVSLISLSLLKETGFWATGRSACHSSNMSPADVVAFRMDWAQWLASLSHRNAAIAEAAAGGETGIELARRFGVTEGRIAQLRRWLRENYEGFGNLPE